MLTHSSQVFRHYVEWIKAPSQIDRAFLTALLGAIVHQLSNNLPVWQGVLLHVLALVANAVATGEATEQLDIAAMLAIRNSASGALRSVRQDILATIYCQHMLAMLQNSSFVADVL
jgi:hypothetical protein